MSKQFSAADNSCLLGTFIMSFFFLQCAACAWRRFCSSPHHGLCRFCNQIHPGAQKMGIVSSIVNCLHSAPGKFISATHFDFCQFFCLIKIIQEEMMWQAKVLQPGNAMYAFVERHNLHMCEETWQEITNFQRKRFPWKSYLLISKHLKVKIPFRQRVSSSSQLPGGITSFTSATQTTTTRQKKCYNLQVITETPVPLPTNFLGWFDKNLEEATEVAAVSCMYVPNWQNLLQSVLKQRHQFSAASSTLGFSHPVHTDQKLLLCRQKTRQLRPGQGVELYTLSQLPCACWWIQNGMTRQHWSNFPCPCLCNLCSCVSFLWFILYNFLLL